MSSSDGTEDAAPASKKPKTAQADGAGTSSDAEQSSSASNSHCLKDSGRRGRLTLRIDDASRFVRDGEEVTGEWVLVSGIKWRLRAFIDGGVFRSYVESKGGGGNDKWHSKAKFWMRLCDATGPDQTEEGFALFDNSRRSWAFRWMRTEDLLTEENGFVVDGAIDLVCEITTFSCYVTDGAYGERARSHDVSFKFDNEYIYASKGFLATNSAFFEAMFFGEFGDNHKDEVTLTDVNADAFAGFLIAISPNPPSIKDNKEIDLLRLASRFQSDTLTERCCNLLLEDETVREAHSFASRLKIADELHLVHFRDMLIARATRSDIDEVAQKDNEDCFSGTTWFKLLLKRNSL